MQDWRQQALIKLEKAYEDAKQNIMSNKSMNASVHGEIDIFIVTSLDYSTLTTHSFVSF